eukprot:4984811-Prymnesium_polylepis.1
MRTYTPHIHTHRPVTHVPSALEGAPSDVPCCSSITDVPYYSTGLPGALHAEPRSARAPPYGAP